MEKSDSIAKLTAAIVEAQKEVQVVEKSAENPFFKSKYADLPAIVKEYQRVFPKHGLAVVQIVEGKGLRTTITHTSGEWMSGLAELLVAKQDPQGLGSAITYMRRYALAAICGIVSSEDDDDGNAGSHKDTAHPPKSEPRPSDGPYKAGAMAPVPDKLTCTGLVISAGEANKGGYIPYTIEGMQMDDGKDMKFTTNNPALAKVMDDALADGSKVHVTYTKTAYRGFCSIHNVVPVGKAAEVPF